MPNKHAIWTVGDLPTPPIPDLLLSEHKLEDMIEQGYTRLEGL
jgi:hypothetical protein